MKLHSVTPRLAKIQQAVFRAPPIDDVFDALATQARGAGMKSAPALQLALRERWLELQNKYYTRAKADSARAARTALEKRYAQNLRAENIDPSPYLSEQEKHLQNAPKVREALMALNNAMLQVFIDAAYLPRNKLTYGDEKGQPVRASSEKADAAFAVLDSFVSETVKDALPDVRLIQ